MGLMFVTNSELYRHLRNYHDASAVAACDSKGNVYAITGVTEVQVNGVWTTVVVFDKENRIGDINS
jgi:hypothetical protein